MVLAAATATLVASVVSVASADGCPSDQAIAAHLDRVGAARALAQVGKAEVRVVGSTMRIVIQDAKGTALGQREVEAPADCAARTGLAAVLIAAWAGDWMRTNLGSADRSGPAILLPLVPATLDSSPGAAPIPSAVVSDQPAATRALAAATTSEPSSAVLPAPPEARSSLSTATTPPEPAATAPATRAPAKAKAAADSTRVGFDLAGLGFGIHDGDAGTYGLGVEGTVRFSRLGVVALAETIGDRQRAMGPAQASYGLACFGLGLRAREAWGSAFADVAVVPEIARYAMRGSGSELAQANDVVAWGLLLDARARFGWEVGPVAPFAFAGASFSLLHEHLSLSNRPDSGIYLSRVNLAAGLGFSVSLR